MSSVTYRLFARGGKTKEINHICFSHLGSRDAPGVVSIWELDKNDRGRYVDFPAIGVSFNPRDTGKGDRYQEHEEPDLEEWELREYTHSILFDLGLINAIGYGQTTRSILREGAYIPLTRRTWSETLYILTALRYAGEDPGLARGYITLVKHGMDPHLAFLWAHHTVRGGVVDAVRRSGYFTKIKAYGLYGRHPGHSIHHTSPFSCDSPTYREALRLPWVHKEAPLGLRWTHDVGDSDVHGLANYGCDRGLGYKVGRGELYPFKSCNTALGKVAYSPFDAVHVLSELSFKMGIL